MMQRITLWILILLSINVKAQPEWPVNGPANKLPKYTALTHATIYTDFQTKITDATVIIKDGISGSVGTGIAVPKEAREFNCSGKTIYPGFIDLYSDYGINFKQERKEYNESQIASSKPGAYNWNEAIKSETKAKELFKYDEIKAKTYRECGFGAVVSGLQDGICRGSSVLVSTSTGREGELIIQSDIASGYSFSKGSSTQPYPSSLSGVIALLRQTYYDAQWYKTQTKDKNLSLDAFNQLQTLPSIFAVDNKLDILRADKIGKEFNVTYIYKGAGDEYQRINEIRATKGSLIVPINFPKPYDVDNPLVVQRISTADLKHWELAPSNLYQINKVGVEFTITMKGCDNAAEFVKNLRKAVAFGLDEKSALKALTFTPAKLIHQENVLGIIKGGAIANLIITNGNLFDKTSFILETWSAGQRFQIKAEPNTNIFGEFEINGLNYNKMKISGTNQKMNINLFGTDTIKGTLTLDGGFYQSTIKQKSKFVLLSFWKEKVDSSSLPYQVQRWNGYVSDSVNENKYFSASLTKALKADTSKKEVPQVIELGKVVYPFTDFGWSEQPKQEKVLFKNATVWTNETDSILLNTDVYVVNGKISEIGKGLIVSADKVIDATGKYLTNGIIDEHSHIALTRGVNEPTQAVTAEVRMGDVISSEDINIYRQLSGGVVASQLLHGSANPIGGQSALIKLRWGLTPEEMKISGADGFIKFALGENVKQANWGDRAVFRYPQTRMGVEQTDIDAFTRAREYQNGKKNHVDLELEALSEILNKKRFITCHSYVQSEINMLMHVADTFGFRINTFTHILEGYKVADKMKQHGVGASTFADWWSYKYEVMEAIPYNAALLNQMGVITAINSDDAEMGRRLNQEAAKTIKYGGVREMDAWKMVTLNPAKLLHLDKQTGSIKVGKDADLVLWSDNPLSVYAKVLYTYVDGTCYYDATKDALLREEVKKERNRIVQKMLMDKSEGEKTEKKISIVSDEYHCDTANDYGK